MKSELIVQVKPRAERHNNLQGVEQKVQGKGEISRILRGTGDAGQREFHRVEADEANLHALADELNQDEDVAAAYVKPPMIPPVSPDFTSRQIYLNPAPSGVDASYAWGFAGGRGAGIRIIDIEYNWNLNHEDLTTPTSRLLAGVVIDDVGHKNHGTNVLGIIKGKPNTFGVTGLCSDATVDVVSSHTLGTAQAIRQAADYLQTGDILLLEMQRPGPKYNFALREDQLGYIAVEWWPDDYEAIKYATDKGVIVVEAAGNGAENLSDALYDTNPASPNGPFPSWWVNPFRRTTLDCKAVIVGGGAPPPGTHGRQAEPDRSRRPSSCYGANLDTQAWGTEVTTTGNGTLHAGSGENEWYRDEFGGTSAASAAITGVLGSLQGALKAAGKTLLTPLQARAALRATGTPQQAGTNAPVSQRIGNRADLKALFGYMSLTRAPAPLPIPIPIPIPIPRPPSLSKKAFTLRVYNKLGDRLLETYASESPGGICDGFTSRRYPAGVCGQLDFEAKPNLTAIAEGAITYLEYDTGFRIISIHMGVVTNSPDQRGGGRGVYEVAGGKKLLARRVCGDDALFRDSPLVPVGVDAAWILRELVRRYKHPALKYDEARIPLTGVMVGEIDARGTNLDKAIEAVLKSVPAIGENDWGVDAEGYVVIRPPTGESSLPYSYVEGQFGNIDSDDVVTKATIRVANAVSQGAIVSAGYRPSLITYSYEHPLHTEWGAERSFDLPKNDEGKPVIDVLEYSPRSGAGFTGAWASSVVEQSVFDSFLDGNLNSYVYPSSGTDLVLTVRPRNPAGFIGVAAVIDAVEGSYDLRLYCNFYSQAISNVVHQVAFDINGLKGQGKVEARFIAPFPADSPTVNISQGRILINGTSLANTIKVYEFRALEINDTLLEQIARAQIRLPAREVTQITCARGLGDGSGQTYGGFLLEGIGKTITLTGAPEPITGTIAEVIDTFTTTEGMLSRISTGNALRSPEVRAIQQYLNSV